MFLFFDFFGDNKFNVLTVNVPCVTLMFPNGILSWFSLFRTSFLCRYADRLRIIISSENFDGSVSTVSTTSQSFFVVDLRLKNTHPPSFAGGSGVSGSSSPSSSSSSTINYFADNDVAGDIHDFLKRMEPYGDHLHSAQQTLSTKTFASWYHVFDSSTSIYNFDPVNQSFAIVASGTYVLLTLDLSIY